jgi:DNA-entry nuclease
MELLARGVEMEAYSVEDGGSGICFHVFVYNVQPGVVLDYMTGISHAARENPE